MSHEVNGELVPVGGGDPIPLIREKLTVGRRESCDIPMHFPNISGKHCELSFRNGYWVIRDLGSKNGSVLNGERLQTPKLLADNDVVRFGKYTLWVGYDIDRRTLGQARKLSPDAEQHTLVLSRAEIGKVLDIAKEKEAHPSPPPAMMSSRCAPIAAPAFDCQAESARREGPRSATA